MRARPRLAEAPGHVGPRHFFRPQRQSVIAVTAGFSRFCHDCENNGPSSVGGLIMENVDMLRHRAEKYLERARAVSDRQRARLLLLQAHDQLKRAEEREAEELNARQ
jgi:hypothetical protein